MTRKIQSDTQLSINFEENTVRIVEQSTTVIDMDLEELYAYDPDEPWWNR